MLDWSTFEAESLDIVRRSYTLGDTKERFAWRTVPDSAIKESSYLICPGKIRFSTKKFYENFRVNEECEDCIEEIADPVAVTHQPKREGKPIFFEHHIVYSTTYRVPVLYFNAFDANSELLTLDDLWDELETTNMADENDIWSLVTQGEHPLLGAPYFFIHPCQTQVLMQQIKDMLQNANKKPRYLLPWLSVFGPIASLKLPMQLFMDD